MVHHKYFVLLSSNELQLIWRSVSKLTGSLNPKTVHYRRPLLLWPSKRWILNSDFWESHSHIDFINVQNKSLCLAWQWWWVWTWVFHLSVFSIWSKVSSMSTCQVTCFTADDDSRHCRGDYTGSYFGLTEDSLTENLKSLKFRSNSAFADRGNSTWIHDRHRGSSISFIQ